MDVHREEQLFSDNPLLRTRTYRSIDRRHFSSAHYSYSTSLLSIAVVKAYGGTSDGRLNRWGSHF